MLECLSNGRIISGFARGVPHDMFMNQIRRFAAEVLPRLQNQEIRTVPFAVEAVGMSLSLQGAACN